MVALTRSRWTLAGIFATWKAALALIALASPGSGYDTSTTLLSWNSGKPHFLYKFVRWDAIYFTQIAQHGHIHEQQWAWGIGYPALLSASARCMCLCFLPADADDCQLYSQRAILHCLNSLPAALFLLIRLGWCPCFAFGASLTISFRVTHSSDRLLPSSLHCYT
jgi:hypothetical protein